MEARKKVEIDLGEQRLPDRREFVFDGFAGHVTEDGRRETGTAYFRHPDGRRLEIPYTATRTFGKPSLQGE